MVQSALNPYLMSDAAGTFNVTSDGYVQGMSMDQPAVRNMLAGGVLATAATIPMWGGCAITEQSAPNGFDLSMGGTILQATTAPIVFGSAQVAYLPTVVGQITGFSVFDQNYAAINSPASPVPLTYSGGLVNFYRFGSGARIKLAIDPSLAATLEGGIITQSVSWNFVDQTLQYYTTTANITTTSITWSATNGGQGAVVLASALPELPAVGDTIVFSGATNTGTGGAPAINGVPFIINSVTSTTVFTIAMPAATGFYATIAGTILATRSTGICPVTILKVQIGNSMTVNYNPFSQTATWNRNGSVALVQL